MPPGRVIATLYNAEMRDRCMYNGEWATVRYSITQSRRLAFHYILHKDISRRTPVIMATARVP